MGFVIKMSERFKDLGVEQGTWEIASFKIKVKNIYILLWFIALK